MVGTGTMMHATVVQWQREWRGVGGGAPHPQMWVEMEAGSGVGGILRNVGIRVGWNWRCRVEGCELAEGLEV